MSRLRTACAGIVAGVVLAGCIEREEKITVGADVEAAILNGRGFTTKDILETESLPSAAEASVVLNTRGEVLSVVKSEPMAKDDSCFARSLEMERFPKQPPWTSLLRSSVGSTRSSCEKRTSSERDR